MTPAQDFERYLMSTPPLVSTTEEVRLSFWLRRVLLGYTPVPPDWAPPEIALSFVRLKQMTETAWPPARPQDPSFWNRLNRLENRP